MKHLLGIGELDRGELEQILDLAASFAEVQRRPIPKVPALRGKTVVLAFFEDSTRTRTSFDLAARRLSADVVNFSASSSSTNKGESLRDTVETIAAMGVDAVIVRHASSGAPHRIAAWTDASVINAGDGWHQHPTQALLDSYTMLERFGSLDGRKVAICGDIQHSRVARSNVEAFTKLGAEVVLIGPRTLLPPSLDGWPVKIEPDLDAVLPDLDAVYLLRIQQERLSQGLFPSIREYRARYGLTRSRAERLRSDALIMHPGPMNRGVEIDPEVAGDPRCVVLDQVSAGVPVRMAVLFRLLGPDAAAASIAAAAAEAEAASDGAGDTGEGQVG
ncbi:MAG: aspartate carbamoyltransferase catalytic subunit [Actinomycetota bacterium]